MNILLTPVRTEHEGMTLVSAVGMVNGRELSTQYSIVAGKHADRLMRAISAGRAFTDLEIVRDVHGTEYISCTCHVRGRFLNADLRKIGF